MPPDDSPEGVADRYPADPDNEGRYLRALPGLVAELGIEPFTLEHDDLAVGALVILKVVDARGGTGVYLRSSEGLSWLDRRAMLDYGLEFERTVMGPPIRLFDPGAED